jgi:hypothetical protein
MLAAQPLTCTRLGYHEKIGEGESLSSCKHTLAAAVAFAATALNLMLVLLGQDISSSSKYNHRACDEKKLVNHNNSSKKTSSQIRRARIRRSKRRTSLSAPKRRTVTKPAKK